MNSLLQDLGEGGRGYVFKAWHRKLDRVFALKIVRKDHLADPEAIRRFHREIHAAAQLAHSNIVHAFDADQVGDMHFFVMEYIEGIDLSRLVKEQGPLRPAEACDYIRQAALGLQHAHERGLVHRDIKPSNLMLARRQESDARGQESDLGGQQTTVALTPDPAPLTPVVKILDMGLARFTETEPSAETRELTRTGVVMGTADYMAPEQSEDSHHADIRADIYSLGCTFYFLLTGQVPFPGGTFMNKIFRHQMEQPAPVEKFRPDAPAAVAAIIRRMMAKQPQDRYRTPAEVVAAIDALAKQPEQPTSTGATAVAVRRPTVGAAGPRDPFGELWSDSTAKPMRPQRRPAPLLNMLLAAGGLLAALFFAGLLAFLLRPGGQAENKPTVAEQPSSHGQPSAKERAALEEKNRRGQKADSDRLAADYVLSIGGQVHINDQERAITTAAELPKEPFRLTFVDLRGNKQLTDTGVTHFQDCKNLRGLGLGFTQVTDAGLANFKNCKNLTDLGLGGTQVTDTGLTHFKDCKDLTELYLDRTQVTDTGLAHFHDCKNLTVLDLGGTKVTDTGLAYFKDCKSLRILHLWATQVTDTGLAHFHDCKNLTVLDLWRTRVTDMELAHLKACENLTQLNLDDTKVTISGVAELQKALPKCHITHGDADRRAAGYVLSIGGQVHIDDQERAITAAGELPKEPFRLTFVNLRGNKQVTDAGLAYFKDCKNLAYLHLGDSPVTDAGLALFKDCKNLTYLDLDRTGVTDSGLTHFKDCKNLTSLDLNGTGVTDAGLAPFQDCKNLTYLGLWRTRVSDSGLAHFRDCKNLADLRLDGTPVTDKGLAYFKDCKKLTFLGLAGTRVTDTGLAYFKDCKNLTELYLRDTQVSDASLKHLEGLPNLLELDLTSTQVTTEGIDALKKALPECKVTSGG
jgi:serine/threonine protein kinase/Leucine-rich repeat (LRR) protein